MRTLREQGIRILIFGALSPETFNFAKHRFRNHHGMAWEIEEVLHAYREVKLGQPDIGSRDVADNGGTRPARRVVILVSAS